MATTAGISNIANIWGVISRDDVLGCRYYGELIIALFHVMAQDIVRRRAVRTVATGVSVEAR